MLKDNCEWCVGDGFSINTWIDKWIPSFDIYTLFFQPDCDKASSPFSSHSNAWDSNLI